MENDRARTLYLCYFWLDTPLVQTQVLPYLREIAKSGIKVFLLTFENRELSLQEIETQRQQLQTEGITWYFLKYHKTPSLPATVFDVLNGARFARKLAKKENIDVFHGRVHIPAMMGWIANKFLSRKPKLLFDIRGFFPEEYVDAGIWKQTSFAYKMVKTCEKLLLRDSNAFVTLTEKAREILFPESKETGFDKKQRPVEVIPCCVDFKRFDEVSVDTRNEIHRKLNIENRRVIVYVGSFGGFYMTEETADFFGAAKRRDSHTFALILTQTNPLMIRPFLEKRGYTEKDFFIGKVSPDEIPAYLAAADYAVSFILPSYSKKASSPTKIAEYLAAGLPFVSNSGVGDLDELINDENVGVLQKGFADDDYKQAITKMEKLITEANIKKRCRDVAEKYFDLEKVGGRNYVNLYRRLLNF